MKKGLARLIVCSFVLAVMADPVHADSSLSVTVTPPLFQLSISPGQSWSSALKVVNANAYDVTYYAQPMDFTAEGENGQASFAPVINVPTDTTINTFSLARWIELSPDPVTVKSGHSADIPFSVHIPANAEPGGHYAAILVGTQPPNMKINGPTMKISSYVSSLLFVRVEGDIHESARIREFRTDDVLYQSPDAHFLLRFENLGNTHLKPEGVVTIFNMWGKKRGEIQINRQANFGNVLPKSIRKFEFSWSGDVSLFDIGQYSAVATVNFGDGGKQNTSATTYFWVVPVIPMTATIVGLFVFIGLFVWFIRRYIRRAIALEQEKHTRSLTQPNAAPLESATSKQQAYTLQTLMEPLKEGVIDLRRVAKKEEKIAASMPREVPARTQKEAISAAQFLKKYRLFFVFVCVLIGAMTATYVFFSHVLVPARGYQIKAVSSQVE